MRGSWTRKNRILITTSRRPTRRMRTLCRDLTRSIPNGLRVNRGKLNLDGVAEKALELNADRVIILNRWKGGPGKIDLFQTGLEGLIPVTPMLYVAGVRLQREFRARTRLLRSLAITTSSKGSPQIMKLAGSFSNFLGVPLTPVKENALKYQASLQVSFNASGLIQITFLLLPEAVEVGPCITLSHVAWEFEK